MANRISEKSSEPSTGSISETIDAIQKIVAQNARAPLNSEKQITLFLQSWWSKTFNRPLKDPVLLSYSFEELLYEFYDRIERQKAAEESLKQESVKIEENKEKEIESWIEREEKRELEEEAKKQEKVSKPTDEENIKWMEEQLKKEKELLGDDFGEDFNMEFDE